MCSPRSATSAPTSPPRRSSPRPTDSTYPTRAESRCCRSPRRQHDSSILLYVTENAENKADALVFFGATGDLAYKQIFPALHALARAGRLDMPVIGVARS